ncbi:hypothetical protein [uncultured Tenacibaculum sp.]|uniref:hypothetical protein n=1 Tax=uncultured Tenacibaculum sp. TaxID=174713 RepID=UPI0026241136|nr:hypothetical protein [uncultured Tenacibaculum sp.]
MKLEQIKNLGKELKKQELVNVTGGDIIVGYMCDDGTMGTVRGPNDGHLMDGVCGDLNYRITYTREGISR